MDIDDEHLKPRLIILAWPAPTSMLTTKAREAIEAGLDGLDQSIYAQHEASRVSSPGARAAQDIDGGVARR